MSMSSFSVLLVAAAAIAPLCAQESVLLFDAPQVQLPDDSPPFQRLGDFDGDGRKDAVGSRVNSNGTQYEVRVWRNNQGVFAQRFTDLQALTLGTGSRMSIAVGDFDGDGDQDFVAGCGLSVFLYTNQGNFVFTRSVLLTTNDTVSDVALADVDGDGRLDLVYLVAHTSTPGAVGVRLADGTRITLPEPVDMTSSARIEVCDLDGDPEPEFGVWSPTATHFHPYQLVNRTLVPMPDLVAGGSYNYWSSGDLDGDGDTDIVCSVLTQPGQLVVFRRTGPTSFTAEPPYPCGPVEFLADVDGDGHLDGICCGGGGSPATWPMLNFGSYTRISLNRGGVLGPTFEIPNKGSSQLAGVADVDGDGDMDIVAGACVYFARGSLTEKPGWPTGYHSGVLRPSQREVLDIDRDGDPDFGFGVTGRGFSDGTGALRWVTDALPIAAGLEIGQPVCCGDFDGDGAPDLVVPLQDASDHHFVAMQLLRNNGSGTLIDGGVACAQRIGWLAYPYGDPYNSFVVADVDGDGHLDIVATSDPEYENSQRSEIWYNLGNGTFAPGPTLPGERIEVVADFDGDGIVDFVTRAGTFPSVLRLRLGTGVPAAPFGPPLALFLGIVPEIYPDAVKVADANDDGRPDLVITVYHPSATDTVSIYCNTTAAAGLPSLAAQATFGQFSAGFGGVYVADFDGDGRSDVAVVNPIDKQMTTRIYLRTSQQGAPLVFAPPIDQVIWDGFPVDADGDGDIDMLGSWCTRNVRWHGAAAGKRQQYGAGTAGEIGVTPLLGVVGPLRAGGTIELRLRGVTGPTAALLAVGFAPAQVPDFVLPGLNLLVDPGAMLTLFWTLTQPGNGMANGGSSSTLQLPPGLTNVDFYDQVFVLDPAAPSGVASSNGLRKHIGG
jgi:hypothetical protein